MKRKRVAMVYDPDWRCWMTARQWRMNQEWRRLAMWAARARAWENG